LRKDFWGRKARGRADQLCSEVVGQDRGRAHGENARFGARRMGEMGAIPCREDGVVCDTAKLFIYGDKAIGQMQTCSGQPIMRARARRPDCEV